MKKIKIQDLIPDNKNNNRHTDYGMDLLEKSMRKVGIIESITISNDNKIISGNARHEKAGQLFDTEAIIIETDGTRPVILKRTDIESDTKQFYEASILANTTSKKNIDFDNDVIDELAIEFDLDIEELGIDVVEVEEVKDPFDDDGIESKNQYGVIVICGNDTEQESVFERLTKEGLTCKVVVT